MEDNDRPTPAGVSDQPQRPMPWLSRGGIDEQDPTRDGRVAWLVDEVCNRQALLHRYEDVRRRERGGKWDGSGYPLVQVDDRTLEQLGGHEDVEEGRGNGLDAGDSGRAWIGLIKLVQHQFGLNDDVATLVKLLAEDLEVQESFGSQWPIGKIVRALNERDRTGSWNDDRVENAKRRLTKWVIKVKSTQGLDAIDFRALLARYARENDPRSERAHD
jgi:hypothetical protein